MNRRSSTMPTERRGSRAIANALSPTTAVSFLVVFLLAVALRAGDEAPDSADVRDTQKETVPLLTPGQALASIELPEGFRATLFAAEPDVRQPIAMAFDARGRLWVAENYTYADSRTGHALDLRDRIIILEDSDGDGRADRRKVFWDDAQRLTSIELGHGGVWALCPPQLLFIPDRDRDDRPDGEPVVLLDGWEADASRHNFANGLRWGPDGWLHGRHGILATSRVGAPGTSRERRTTMNCGIWRFHPTRRVFEVLCHGTTNPWGADWDADGQMFFINTVIGHLWHVIPGAHYKRMYGQDLDPHVYELIDQTADHVHWDVRNESWTAQKRGLSAGSDRAGGGHAHSGMMIYLGESWPEEYRGDVFTVNLHGLRLNRDRITRAGATYVARHERDFLSTRDVWFRGIDLGYGPHGGVHILDWSDIGECHENDGVHRSSGRIFRILHGDAAPASRRLLPDLHRVSAAALAGLQALDEGWTTRIARRILAGRAAAAEDLTGAEAILRRLLRGADPRHRLRGLWGLSTIGALETRDLLRGLGDGSEHVRLWSTKLLVDDGAPGAAAVGALHDLVAKETSGLVLTFLASAMGKLAHADRWPIAAGLVTHAELATDPVLPLMVWYGIEPAVAVDSGRAAALVEISRMPRVDRLVARRVAESLDDDASAVDPLVELLARTRSPLKRRAVLEGLAAGLRAWRKAPEPAGWSSLVAGVESASGEGSERARVLVGELSLVFGGGRSPEQLHRIALDGGDDPSLRRRAVRSLVDARAAGVVDLLLRLLRERDVAPEAARGLGAFPGAAPRVLDAYDKIHHDARVVVVEVLASRPGTAALLLGAVEAKVVARTDVTPFHLRQIQLHDVDTLNDRIGKLWPDLRLIAADKLPRIAAYRDALTAQRPARGDIARGKEVFTKSCGSCHKLFGEGGAIGPELTGAQRGSLDYWLENIVDPSAVVPQSYRMSILLGRDGSAVNGVIVQETSRALTVQTPTERLELDPASIASRRGTSLSLMPEGILETLEPRDARDLFAYLMAGR